MFLCITTKNMQVASPFRTLKPNPVITPVTGRFIKTLDRWKTGLVGFSLYHHILSGITCGFHIGIHKQWEFCDRFIADSTRQINLSFHERDAIDEWILKAQRDENAVLQNRTVSVKFENFFLM